MILVVFLAAYLADNRPLLAGQSWRVGSVSLPPLPYLLPMLAMWGIAMAVVIVQRDLGAALLFFTVFLGLLYVATRRVSYVVFGLVLFARRQRGAVRAVRARARRASTSGSTRTRIRSGTGYQVIRGAVRVRARRRPGHRPRRRAAAGGQRGGHPGASTPTSSSRPWPRSWA